MASHRKTHVPRVFVRNITPPPPSESGFISVLSLYGPLELSFTVDKMVRYGPLYLLSQKKNVILSY